MVEIVIQRIGAGGKPVEEVICTDEETRVVLIKRYGRESPYGWQILHDGPRFDGEEFARLMKESGKTPRA